MKKSITFALCFQSFYRKLVGITVHYIAGNLIGSLFFLAIVVLWNRITGKSMCLGIDVSKSEQEVFDISHSSELCSE